MPFVATVVATPPATSAMAAAAEPLPPAVPPFAVTVIPPFVNVVSAPAVAFTEPVKAPPFPWTPTTHA